MTDVPGVPSLGRTVSRALGWSAMGEVLGRVGGFGVGIVLARLLTKEDFGAYAVALVAVNLLIVVNDLGVIAAVIRWQGDEQEIAPTAATLCFAFSVAMYALVFLLSPAFAGALGAPEATNLVRTVAAVILIDGLTAVPQAVLVRTFRNDRLAVAEFFGFAVGTPVTITMAVLDAGAWSIVVGRVVSAAVVALIIIVVAPYRVRPGLHRPTAAVLLRFGTPLSVSAVISQAVLNVDYIIVGRILGKTDLGVYLLAFNLSSWPVSLVSTAVARVAFAGFSRLVEDRSRLAGAFPRVFGVALAVLAPMVVLLAILGPEVIGFVYGRRWLAAATPLRFLVVLGGFRILIDLLIDLAIADNRPGAALAVRSVWLAVLVPSLAVGAELAGLGGVGLAHLVVAAVVVMPWLLASTRRSGIPVAALARYSRRPLAAAAVSAAVMAAVLPLLSGAVLRLVVAGGAGSLAYVAVLVPGNPLVPWVLSLLRPVGAASS